MNFDILELLNSTLGGPLIRQASAYFGETEKSTHSALRSIEPTLLAGLMQWASTPAGVAEVFKNVTDDGVDTGIAAKLPGIFSNRGSLESLLDSGELLADKVFGSRMGGVTSAISKVSGAMPDSALALISLTAPLLFGTLKKHVTQNDLNASGLGVLLRKQRGRLANSQLPDRVISAMGFGSKAELLDSLPAVGTTRAADTVAQHKNVRAKTERERAWLPWAVAAGVAVLGSLFFVNRTAEHYDVETASVPAAPDSTQPGAAPTRVYFEAGEARIDREDRQRIASAAASAKTHDRPVAVTGYTDRSGDEERNYELAKDRAHAVRDALVDEGVAEEKIVMDPPALIAGSGETGEARRVDIDLR